MGNLASNETDEDTPSSSSTVASSHASHSSEHTRTSRPKLVPRPRFRLVPLSGSPSTSTENDRRLTRSAPEQSNMPVYHLTPNTSRPADELSEEEQVKIAQRIGLIQHLPRSTWDVSKVDEKKTKECCICMIDFENDEHIRYLPCMHYYHLECIDDWLMRSFTCPSCMEPVDAALLSTYGNDSTGMSLWGEVEQIIQH